MPVYVAPTLRTRTAHAAVVTASSYNPSGPGSDPTLTASNALLLLAFTLSTDGAYRQFKIPYEYVGNASVHVHWTKTSNANESGKAVKWRISYVSFASTTVTAEDGSVSPTVVEVEDTYDDSGTTTRLVHCTADVALSGVSAGDYMSLKIEAVTPAGTAMASEPGLFSVDIEYDELI